MNGLGEGELADLALVGSALVDGVLLAARMSRLAESTGLRSEIALLLDALLLTTK